ncbi:helix-turn-helix transcriptional regulator [Agromyces atrinae]|uniref:helix-turn-helix transcriptional regulator n=1 Tax=Agromyces atrinae TaxID=592376 RepID=UPI001F570A0D|nr:helix-turn-helix transcriptional regulator [Agromyces atrinae]MCI2957916.1 helix-turn-helix transcriptional regulator [Agromyces atrinae]
MDNRDDIRAFLTSRRARITPEQAGVPFFGGKRRVPGLRREEVAMMAGVSTDYYTRLERGNLSGVSDSVLASVASALRLDEAETSHLFDLARAARAGARSTRARSTVLRARDGIQLMLDSIEAAPAFVRNARMDLVAGNLLCRALYSPLFTASARPVNHSRFIFLNPAARHFYLDWDRAADDNVAILRTEAGRNPFDRGLTDLVGELSTRSHEFCIRWASHAVSLHHSGSKTIVHPVVGELDLEYNALDMLADPGLTLTIYNAVRSSSTEEKLRLLASWALSNTGATVPVE